MGPEIKKMSISKNTCVHQMEFTEFNNLFGQKIQLWVSRCGLVYSYKLDMFTGFTTLKQ